MQLDCSPEKPSPAEKEVALALALHSDRNLPFQPRLLEAASAATSAKEKAPSPKAAELADAAAWHSLKLGPRPWPFLKLSMKVLAAASADAKEPANRARTVMVDCNKLCLGYSLCKRGLCAQQHSRGQMY